MRMFGRRRRQTTLAILARNGYPQGPAAWATRCRDGAGRPSTVVVRVLSGVVTLEGPDFGLVYLSPLQLGRLRSVLRDAIIGTTSGRGRHHLDEEPGAPPEPMPRQRAVAAEPSTGRTRPG